MGFLRNIAGSVIALTVAAAVGYGGNVLEYAATAVGIQWLAALCYAIPKRDERYFDLTGAITHATIVRLAFRVNDEAAGWRGQLLTGLVWIWCCRLGLFLYWRILERGEDSRFAEIRTNPLRFFSVWTIQGLWVFLTDLPVLLSLAHGQHSAAANPFDLVGGLLWVVGFMLEALADWQKTQFRRVPSNKGKFISTGLWAYSRHPNYLGEILMWVAIYIVVFPSLAADWKLQLLAAISPAFVTLLLTTVSGIPLLEKQGDDRWGKTKEYQQYKARTSVLLLLPQRKLKSA